MDRDDRAGAVNRRSRGAVIVEFALVAPMFFGLLYGVAEGATWIRDQHVLGNMAAAGARAASVSGNLADADERIVAAAVGAAATMRLAQIELIVVFRATGPNDTVPDGCRDGVPSGGNPENGLGACNVYRTADLTDMAAAGCDAASPARFYCPTSRRVTVDGPPDHVGVFVRVRHRPLLGIGGFPEVLERTTIARIEPQALHV